MAANSLFTLSELATQVANNYGATDDVTIAKAKQWINRALMRMRRRGQWQFLEVLGGSFSTVASQEVYVMDTSILKINALWTKDTNRKLVLLDNREFRESIVDGEDSTGDPSTYRLAGRDTATGGLKIALWPVPSSATTIYVDSQKTIPLLTADSDDIRLITGMPDHYIEAVIDLASALGSKERDDGDYQAEIQEAELHVQALWLEDQTQLDDDLTSREFSSSYVIDSDDPVLPTKFGRW